MATANDICMASLVDEIHVLVANGFYSWENRSPPDEDNTPFARRLRKGSLDSHTLPRLQEHQNVAASNPMDLCERMLLSQEGFTEESQSGNRKRKGSFDSCTLSQLQNCRYLVFTSNESNTAPGNSTQVNTTPQSLIPRDATIQDRIAELKRINQNLKVTNEELQFTHDRIKEKNARLKHEIYEARLRLRHNILLRAITALEVSQYDIRAWLFKLIRELKIAQYCIDSRRAMRWRHLKGDFSVKGSRRDKGKKEGRRGDLLFIRRQGKVKRAMRRLMREERKLERCKRVLVMQKRRFQKVKEEIALCGNEFRYLPKSPTEEGQEDEGAGQL